MGEDIVTVRDFLLEEIGYRSPPHGSPGLDDAREALAAFNRLAAAFHARGAALAELLAACIEEYGEPDDGEANESVGWNGDGSTIAFTYGHMQRARDCAPPASAERDGGEG